MEIILIIIKPKYRNSHKKPYRKNNSFRVDYMRDKKRRLQEPSCLNFPLLSNLL